jgi:hypothetical protein
VGGTRSSRASLRFGGPPARLVHPGQSEVARAMSASSVSSGRVELVNPFFVSSRQAGRGEGLRG